MSHFPYGKLCCEDLFKDFKLDLQISEFKIYIIIEDIVSFVIN